MTDPNPLEVSFDWTPEFAEAVTRRVMSRRSGFWSWSIAAIAVLGTLGMMVDAEHGVRFRWSGWAFPALLLLNVFQMAKTREDAFRRAAATAMRLSHSRVTVRFGDEWISTQSADSSSSMRWAEVSKLVESPSVWLLYLQDDRAIIPIPTKILPEALRERIEAKVREHGGVVRSI
jgi:hypothetical protein